MNRFEAYKDMCGKTDGLIIATDGSCRNVHDNPCNCPGKHSGCGVVVLDPKNGIILDSVERWVSKDDLNYAEFRGVLTALEKIDAKILTAYSKYKSFHLICDSRCVLHALLGWCKTDKFPVLLKKTREIIEKLQSFGKNVIFNWVPGHTLPLHNEADFLAEKAASDQMVSNGDSCLLNPNNEERKQTKKRNKKISGTLRQSEQFSIFF